ncbi:hypothetical protein IAQ61_008427 [Plenodomus lingam]|uniref:Predicted protein n=1 Tax=Leptosphaeria maculans (strain JN3 / isolate v23.1.3 / race Av1-4-5-6-7-8) TaxID=985895 RepID=E4ZUA9_LEPMJ|nr:predicted protein [Plenodomus lingam JN3]KAH9866422.1 hypothetical protein IAQ61_008427 [Plenodomus lingam]CBX94988.1 predicted protein [Plenodomus lingam JN3]
MCSDEEKNDGLGSASESDALRLGSRRDELWSWISIAMMAAWHGKDSRFQRKCTASKSEPASRHPKIMPSSPPTNG